MQTRISEAQAKELMERYGALKAFRAPWVSLWEDIGKYVSPRRAPGINGTITTPTTENESRLFDITAGQSVMTLSNGCLAWMSPQESPWFSFAADELLKDNEADRFLNRCTVSTRESLGRSNFYTAVHEFYLDRSGFGTGCLYVEPGRKKRINAQCWPIGSYVIDEDDEGEVDTVIREMLLTPRTAAQKFGKENLSPTMQKCLAEGGSDAVKPVKFLHFIYPRDEEDRKPGSLAPEDMEIACVYMEEGTQFVVRVSGYDEMPVFVSRYLEWGSNMGTRYGWSPSFAALPEARQVNFLQKMMDALAEKAAFPPILAPDELEGEIDPNAAGVTYFSQDIAARLPKEWMTAGRYDVGKDRILERQNAIKAAFHVDLFQMFSQLEKQMTAREVAERSSEKLIQFSPTFARLTTELFNPLLERLFGMGLRAGWFGEVPDALIIDVGEGRGFVAPPNVLYSSRIALALRSLPVLALHRMLELTAGLAQFAPDVVDNFDTDAAWQMAALNEALPDGVARSKIDRDSIRKARAEAQAQAAQQQQAAAMADGASKLGRIPSDSPVAKVIGKQIDQAA
jgi:hypothetical protein